MSKKNSKIWNEIITYGTLFNLFHVAIMFHLTNELF